MLGKRWSIPRLLSAVLRLLLLQLVPSASSTNIETNHVTYLLSPVSTPSQFGYSVVVQTQEDYLTFWVGAPKYSFAGSSSTSSSKPGALFRCTIEKDKIKASGNQKLRCSSIALNPLKQGFKGPYLNANSIKLTFGRRPKHTVLVSPLIETRKNLVQCLQFCFNAYTVFDNARRQLEVSIEYFDKNGTSLKEEAEVLFRFKGLKEKWSIYWNYTEKNIIGKHDGFYRVYFNATLFPYEFPHKNCRFGAADIALSDVAITSSSCEEEASNVDEIVDEESIGLNLEYKSKDKNLLSLASCGPLWQQNCGYSREVDGACYELTVNATHVKNVTSHKPLVRECIRGKIDVVLVVDQSGSVNHCNFQKVKRWLRSMVRSFNIGTNEQDIAVIVYSSIDKTNIVIPLGFNDSWISSLNKKEVIVKYLKDLSYAAGSTFTGYALKKANEELASGRKDAKKIIILLTDGATTKKNIKELSNETERAREQNVTILAIGVGNFKSTELVEIAGNEKYVFSVKKFSELEKIRDSLRNSLKMETIEGESKEDNHSSSWPRQCQLGFSVHYSQKSLLMGSPGCYHMSGNVISYQLGQEDDYEESSTSKNQLGSEFDSTFSPFAGAYSSFTSSFGFNETKKKLSKFSDYKIPTLPQLKKVFSESLSDSYIGYAVTSGYFFGFHRSEFVAVSAPRYKLKGAVLVYQSLTEDVFHHRHLFGGRQLGEYFGASLCVTDLNADQFDDLLVGAPLHIGSYPDEGRVYVYLGGNNLNEEPDFTLSSSKEAFSRFGSHISAVGDLNKDGYGDVAVSAPLQGQGVVYIFYGGKNGITEKSVQKINPVELNPLPSFSIQEFGRSVVGKVDIDHNNYPDLIISSPENDVLVALLSRPVINVDLQLYVPTRIDAQSENCRDQRSCSSPCLESSVCFLYNGASISSAVVIEFDVEADTMRHDFRFFSCQNTSSNFVRSFVSLPKSDIYYCQNFSFILRSRARDLMSATNVRIKYHLKDQQQDPSVSLNDSNYFTDDVIGTTPFSILLDNSTRSSISKDFKDKKNFKLPPVLSVNNNNLLEKTIYFQSSCNKLDQCKSDIVVDATVIDSSGKELSELLIGPEQLLRLRVRLMNKGPEDAYDAAIIIKYSKALFVVTRKPILQSPINQKIMPNAEEKQMRYISPRLKKKKKFDQTSRSRSRSRSSTKYSPHTHKKNQTNKNNKSKFQQDISHKKYLKTNLTTETASNYYKQEKSTTTVLDNNINQPLKLTATVLVGCLIGFGVAYGGYRFVQSLVLTNTIYSGSSKFDINSNNDDFLPNIDNSDQNHGQARRVNINSGTCGKLHSSLTNIHQKRNIKYLNESSSPVGRIVGGSTARIYHYPWQVSLWIKGSHACGGSVIASNWILFAAHCTMPYSLPSDWSVYAGKNYQNQMRDSAQYAQVTKIIVHYLFDQDTFDHDIALLKLDRDLRFDINVNSICLPESSQHLVTNSVCKISGWGAEWEGSGTTNALLATSVRVIDKDICNSEDWLYGLVSPHMFCAGSEDGMTDACQGDSGSPLSCYIVNFEKSFVMGIVSWGIGCGQPKAPGVYTHVGLYYDWIKSKIETN